MTGWSTGHIAFQFVPISPLWNIPFKRRIDWLTLRTLLGSFEDGEVSTLQPQICQNIFISIRVVEAINLMSKGEIWLLCRKNIKFMMFFWIFFPFISSMVKRYFSTTVRPLGKWEKEKNKGNVYLNGIINQRHK